MGNPALLLLVAGTLIGFNFPLGKLAGEAGVSPLLWAMIVSVGAVALLLPVLTLRGHLRIPRGRLIRYILFAALLSFVVPNTLLFAVIPHVGAGYAGLMFALSPVFTLAIATLFRLKPPSPLGLLGISIGLAGAVVVSVTRGTAPEAPPMVWLLASLLVPLSLACGNVYRTVDWPEGALPDVLAFWSHGVAVLIYLSLGFAFQKGLYVAAVAQVPVLALAQAVVAGLTFPVFFRLQQKGGPVLLSQVGYVAAAVSLLTATLLLDERYRSMTWMGALVIASGIAVTVVAQFRRR
jgi:drug/metabolite transporter (DMT)-like permease